MSLSFELSVDAADRRIELRSESLALEAPWDGVRELIGRLISSSLVDSVRIHRVTATATLTIASAAECAAGGSPGYSLRQIAASLRRPAEPRNLLSDVYANCRLLEVRRLGDGVTASVILSQVKGRIRVRHPLLRRNVLLMGRVENALRAIPGVETVSTSTLTGSVLILFREGTVTAFRLIGALERVCSGATESTPELPGPPVSHWVAAGTCLSLAVASTLQPGLAPITAGALILSNLPTLSRGIVELCTFRWKVASLYTVIMGTTLATGGFLAAALMQASVTSWHAWTNYRLRRLIKELTVAVPNSMNGGYRSRIDVSETGESGRFTPGFAVEVPAGAVLPFDGEILEGEADLDEHGVRGVHTPARRSTGEMVYAGSQVLRGRLQVKVLAVESRTRLAAIQETVHSLICETVGTGAATKRGKAIASRFVPYTFATGTAAMLVGDLTTLAAVLRPDFCTGPSVTERLGALTSVSHLLHEGWLVRNCDALHALEKIDTIAVVNMPSEITGPVSRGGFTRVSSGKFARGIEVCEIEGSAVECVGQVRQLCRENRRVAVMAPSGILRHFSSDEAVRISICADESLDLEHGDLIALHSEPAKVHELLQILHESRSPGRKAWAALLTCNMMAISGAFLIGLTSLHVVALTNVGALAAGLFYERKVKRSQHLLWSHAVQTLPSPDHAFGQVIKASEIAESIPADPALQPVVPRHGPAERRQRVTSQRLEPVGSP